MRRPRSRRRSCREVDDHRKRLEVEQRGEGELAEDERHRDEGGREHSGHDVGQHNPRNHGEPPRAKGAAGLGQRRHVDRGQGRVDGPVGVREHQYDVREGQHQRRVTEEVGDPGVDVGDADDDHQRGDGQRQQAEVLDQARRSRYPKPDPDHGRHQQSDHHHDREQAQQQRGDDRFGEGRVLHQVAPGLAGATGGPGHLGAEVQHRQQRDREERGEEQQQQPAGHPPDDGARHCSRAARRSSKP